MAQLKTGYSGSAAVRHEAEGRPSAGRSPTEAAEPDSDAADAAALEARAEAEIQRFIQSGELHTPDVQQNAAPQVVPARERAEPSSPPPAPSPPPRREAEPSPAVLQTVAMSRSRPDELVRLPEPGSAAPKEDKRLTIARISAQRAESALAQMTRRLERTEATLAARTTELAHARAAHEEERARWTQGPVTAEAHKAAREAQWERRTKIALRLIRDLALTVVVVALAVLVTQRAVPVAVNAWQHEAGPQSEVRPLLEKAGLAKSTANEAHAMVVVPSVHLRSRPASGAPVVATVSRNERVTLLRRHGKWMQVQIGESPNQQQGWVAASALQDSP